MTKSIAERAGRSLLYEIADPGPSTTERALQAALADRFDKESVGMGLRWLKRRGWAIKQSRPPRPGAARAWELTDTGRAELDRRVARLAAYEVAGHLGATTTG